MCRSKVVWESDAGGRSLTGEIAHIVGAQRAAARGKVPFFGDRDGPDNLMLLCRTDHKIIDDNEDAYPVERLHEFREEYLAWLESQLTPTERWSAGIISQYTYLNVPRLGEFAATLGFHIRHQPLSGATHLSELNYELNHLMQQYRLVLENLPVESVPVDKIGFAHEGYVGQIVSFKRLRFRNRNVPIHRPEGHMTSFTGTLEHDPHIYHAFPDWRFVINIDLRWITTNTAYGLVRSGGAGSLFSGFSRINAVDFESKTMFGTGLAIGIPPSIFDLRRKSKISLAEPVDMSTLEDDITKSRNEQWTGTVASCDGCGKMFVHGDYMVDGPLRRDGPWGNICESCFLKGDRLLGVGFGQLYRKTLVGWPLVGGYPRALSDDEDL
ncbi:hypothetical protein [Neorhizobium sp. AL 9.2.2]|uniref:hypothetical protein n=1 Tax=Neorhizobium sp. AL 9.2.2 TaxID=2712894 RepID=UPI001AEDC694|nr:hypothetical protein [Neorhizobium sp. AL 9.2.2]NSY16165.1 hypothetical protein [Neorhizobium sp. AL 9.2.2]